MTSFTWQPSIILLIGLLGCGSSCLSLSKLMTWSVINLHDTKSWIFLEQEKISEKEKHHLSSFLNAFYMRLICFSFHRHFKQFVTPWGGRRHGNDPSGQKMPIFTLSLRPTGPAQWDSLVLKEGVLYCTGSYQNLERLHGSWCCLKSCLRSWLRSAKDSTGFIAAVMLKSGTKSATSAPLRKVQGLKKISKTVVKRRKANGARWHRCPRASIRSCLK